MPGMGFISVVSMALLIAAASDMAAADDFAHGRDLSMKKAPLCMWLERGGTCVADIFGMVKDEQVLAETKALEECPPQETQEDCEKAENCFWNKMQERCITDVTTLNRDCYFDEWNTIQRTFQCPQFGTEEKCTDGLPSCAWIGDACDIDDDAVQEAVKSNETIGIELDQFQACREAADACDAPCVEDPVLGCVYNDIFNPLRFVKEDPSSYCQLQIARSECTVEPDCDKAEDCEQTEEGSCIISPPAIVKYALADNPKAVKKVTKALDACLEFTTEEECLAHK